MNAYDEEYDAAKRAAARELQPMVDAISDAIFLFNEVGKTAPDTKEQMHLFNRCREMAKWLDRILKLSPLRHLIPENPEPPQRDSDGARPPRPEPSQPFAKS